jgi:hypothetical protein
VYGVGIKEGVYEVTKAEKKCLVSDSLLHLFGLLKNFSHYLVEKVIRYN